METLTGPTTLAAQDVTSELAVSLYTNSSGAAQRVAPSILLSGVAGDGLYSIGLRITRGGNDYDTDRSELIAAAGQTRIAMPGRDLTLNDGDVMSALILGTAGDNSIAIIHQVDSIGDDSVLTSMTSSMALLISRHFGLRTLTDNGDGTKIARFYYADGVTPAADLTFNAAGEITAVTIDP